jgi:ERF superfamily
MTQPSTQYDAPASTLAEALSRVQAEIPRVKKTSTGKVRSEKANYDYGYADLAEVTAAILPILGKHGLAFLAMPTMSEGRPVLRYKLMHGASGQEECGEWPIVGSKAQEHGSAITYARRYALQAVTGVAPDDDDDDGAAANSAPAGDAWGNAKPAPRKTAPKPAAKKAPVPQETAPLPPELTPEQAAIKAVTAEIRDIPTATAAMPEQIDDWAAELGGAFAGKAAAPYDGLMAAAALYIALEERAFLDFVVPGGGAHGAEHTLAGAWLARLTRCAAPGEYLPTKDELRLTWRAAKATGTLQATGVGLATPATIEALIERAIEARDALDEAVAVAAAASTPHGQAAVTQARQSWDEDAAPAAA